MPASGKSTLARFLSRALGMPILEKDEIKEALFDTLGYADLVEKRRLDTIATEALLRCTESLLKSGSDLIMVNNFESSMASRVDRLIETCSAACVTVFLGGDPEVFYQRYVERDRKKTRHQGHTFIDRYPPLPQDDVNRSMTREYFADRFEKEGMDRFRIAGERIEVDATHPELVDREALLGAIREAFVKIEEERK